MESNQGGESGVTTPLRCDDSYQRGEQHWKAVFEKYDRNGNGNISYRELKDMIHDSTYSNDIPNRVVKIIMQKADSNDNGYLEYPEFVDMIHRKDMQGAFGHLVQYVHFMIPQRPTDDAREVYQDEYTYCNPPPLAMIILSILQIFVFFYDSIITENNTDNSKGCMINGTAATLFIYHPHQRPQVWRYLTCMFVHTDAFHLMGNVFVQLMLGIPLEMVHQWWRVLTIYIAGVVAASLAVSVFTNLCCVGASGGVHALMTAHVATILVNWSQMESAVQKLLTFLIMTSFHTGISLYITINNINNNDKLSDVGHLAGIIAGLLVGINVLRNLRVQPWEKVAWWVSIITYTVLITAASLWNIFASSSSSAGQNTRCRSYNDSVHR